MILEPTFSIVCQVCLVRMLDVIGMDVHKVGESYCNPCRRSRTPPQYDDLRRWLFVGSSLRGHPPDALGGWVFTQGGAVVVHDLQIVNQLRRHVRFT